jgi:hypothetical protein
MRIFLSKEKEHRNESIAINPFFQELQMLAAATQTDLCFPNLSAACSPELPNPEVGLRLLNKPLLKLSTGELSLYVL